MLQTLKHTIRNVMPSRITVSNRVTISAKKIRPVFVERENPDTPPAITDSTREIARYMRNTNNLIKLYTIPGLDKEHTKLYFACVATVNDDKPLTTTKHEQTPRPNYPAHKMHFMTAYGNIRHEDKPAFRHDSLFLFDSLSEVYSA